MPCALSQPFFFLGYIYIGKISLAETFFQTVLSQCLHVHHAKASRRVTMFWGTCKATIPHGWYVAVCMQRGGRIFTSDFFFSRVQATTSAIPVFHKSMACFCACLRSVLPLPPQAQPTYTTGGPSLKAEKVYIWCCQKIGDVTSRLRDNVC